MQTSGLSCRRVLGSEEGGSAGVSEQGRMVSSREWQGRWQGHSTVAGLCSVGCGDDVHATRLAGFWEEAGGMSLETGVTYLPAEQ